MNEDARVTGTHRVVSSEAEELILVDEQDNETGFASKAESHDGHGILHRAFSVFLFNDRGELLLQQRSPAKRLWGGYWSNSCCSHPRRGESMEVATRRRLQDELNIDAELEFVYKFAYQADFGDVGAENELCHVFLGRCDEVQPNASEIAAIRFISADDLDAEFAARPETLTPWFGLEWESLQREHRETLAKYCEFS
jgi:isopentenyl-diphosphate delta-isomerase